MSFIDDGFDIAEWNQDEAVVVAGSEQSKRGPSKTMQVIDLVSDSDSEREMAVILSDNDPEITAEDVVAQVVQILPDIDPSFVRDRFEEFPRPRTANTLPVLISTILDQPSFPRINRKRNATELDNDSIEAVNYADTNRPPPNSFYKNIASQQLLSKFPTIPAANIHKTMSQNNHLYAPSFIALQELRKTLDKELKKPRTRNTPLIDLQSSPDGKDVAAEMAWIEAWLERKEDERERQRRKIMEEEDAEAARLLNFKLHEESGGLLECACCFDECPANCMTSCADGHVFCLECAQRNAETVVGNGGHVFKCMDVSGCKAEFTIEETRRFVNEKTLALRDKLESGDAIREASIEGFVTCPFCDYGAIVEDDNDKEFRCQNPQCKIISCRSCRNESHIPLSCQEHQKEHKLSAKHIVEEAMTAALVQKCNKCTKPFVKLSGCNKMTCNCGNLQCYVCGENIRDYRHFEKGKCPLHEQNDTRLDTKIMNAQEVAMKQVMEQEEGLKEEDLRVEIKRPEAPVAAMGQQAPVNPFLDLADFAPGGRFDPAAQVYPLQFLNQLNARHIGVQQFPEGQAAFHGFVAGFPPIPEIPPFPPLPYFHQPLPRIDFQQPPAVYQLPPVLGPPQIPAPQPRIRRVPQPRQPAPPVPPAVPAQRTRRR